jgi:hypothetical protein
MLLHLPPQLRQPSTTDAAATVLLGQIQCVVLPPSKMLWSVDGREMKMNQCFSDIAWLNKWIHTLWVVFAKSENLAEACALYSRKGAEEITNRQLRLFQTDIRDR